MLRYLASSFMMGSPNIDEYASIGLCFATFISGLSILTPRMIFFFVIDFFNFLKHC